MNKQLVSTVGLALVVVASIGAGLGVAGNSSNELSEGSGGSPSPLSGCAWPSVDCDDTPVPSDDEPNGLLEDGEPKGDGGPVPQPVSATPAPPEGNGGDPEPLPMCVELNPACDDTLVVSDDEPEGLYYGDEPKGDGGLVPQPVTGMLAPDLRLTFEETEYTGVEVIGSKSVEGEITAVVCCGTPVDPAEMVVVGTATQHNPDGDAEVEVYRSEYGGTTDVYTFHAGLDAAPGTWIRWATN